MPKPTQPRGLRPDTPRADAAARVIAARLEDVQKYAPQIEREPSREPVHDMRVASRRLRAALRLWKDPATASLERATRILGRSLGGLRDLHVELDWLAHTARSTSSHSELHAIAEITASIEHQIMARAQALCEALAAWRRVAQLPLEELALHGRHGGHAIGRAMARRIEKADRQMRKLDPRVEPDRAHDLRIAVKKLRYVAELLQSAFPHASQAALAAVEPLQDKLGDLHDLDVRTALVSRSAHRGHDRTRSGFAGLQRRLAQERRALAQNLMSEMKAWRRRHTAEALCALIEREG